MALPNDNNAGTLKTAAVYARVSKNRHRCNACDRTFGLAVGEAACPHCSSSDIERGQDPTTQLLPLREYAKRRAVSVSEADRSSTG